MFISLEFQCNKVSHTYGGGENEYTIHDLHCLRESLIAYRFKIPPTKNLALHYISCLRYGDRWTVEEKNEACSG